MPNTRDNFSGASLNTALWHDGSSGPSPSVSEGSGLLSLTANAGGDFTAVGANHPYDLVAAGAAGWVGEFTSGSTSAQQTGFGLINLGSTDGYVFKLSGLGSGNININSHRWNGFFGTDIAGGVASVGTPVQLRIVKSGTNILMQYSTDGGTNWTTHGTDAFGTLDLTSLYVLAFNNGSGAAPSTAALNFADIGDVSGALPGFYYGLTQGNI